MRIPQALPQTQPPGMGKGALLLGSRPGCTLTLSWASTPSAELDWARHQIPANHPPVATDYTMPSFIKPCVLQQVTVTWQWAHGLTLPIPAGYLPEQARFSRHSHASPPLTARSSGASPFVSGASVSLPIKWAHDTPLPGLYEDGMGS